MCGIAGLIDFSGESPDESLLRGMLAFISHRGPDAFGIYVDRHAGLAHARLSIIDLSGGDQPVHNEDKTVWVVYNGEVFNYPELRQGLEQQGHRFYTHTDTEILVHLYEEKGPEFLNDLNGQFAFAIWDSRRQIMMLGRDRLGVRPLFYHLDRDRLWFGSEIKALFADPRVPRAIDHRTVADVFTGWAPLCPLTPFQHILQISPGHFAIFSREGMDVRPYWKLSFARHEGDERPLGELTEELGALLLDAARIRLRADVPVGAYLSGGLDSTCIASIVKRNFNNELRTFSVCFTDGRFDEAPFQDKAVAAIGTEHRFIRCTEKDIGDVFPRVVWHAEAPLLRTAPAPLYRLSRLVRENNFKVVLTGEGSDEIFAGYDIFKEDRIRRFWARRPDSAMRPALLQKLYPDIFSSEDARTRSYIRNFFRKNLDLVDSPAYSHLIRWGNTSNLLAYFSRDIQDAMRAWHGNFIDRFAATLPPDFMRWDPLSRAQYTEITIFLSNYLLASQGDRVAMAHAVEGRYPFLDHRVVEFSTQLPPRYRMCGLRDKFILRRAATGLIPAELAERPKRPYRSPISRCFSGREEQDYTTLLLSPKAVRDAGIFDPDRVGGLVDKCQRQGGNLLSERENMALVGILSTQLLQNLFVDDLPPPPKDRIDNITIHTAASSFQP